MLSEQQEDIVNAVCTSKGDKIIAVNAVAGSGKSFTCKEVVKAFKPKNGFYTAFNKGIVEDTKNKIGEMIPCKTVHSLAYRYANPNHLEIKDLSYRDIQFDGNVKDKIDIVNLIDKFFRSKYDNLNDFIKEERSKRILSTFDTLTDEMVECISIYADKFLTEEIPPTFSFLLKKFHLMLLDKVINPHFDLFIIDECQDLSGVMLEIFKLINSDKKLILGDKYQNIYSFADTINAFEELDPKDMEIYPLTKSFRCKPSVANVVEDYGRSHLNTNFEFLGNDLIKDETKSKVYLSRSNAHMIALMNKLFNQGIVFDLVRNPKEIFALPIAMDLASKGEQVTDPKYKFLNDIQKYIKLKNDRFLAFLDENKETYDENIGYTAKMLLRFKKDGINIYNLYNKVLNMPRNPLVMVSTIHTFKGLEAENVFLDGSIYETVETIMGYKKGNIEDYRKIIPRKDVEELNLLYVALSRAKCTVRTSLY